MGNALTEELYQQYGGPLYCYARRRGYGRDDAQDFTQGFLTEILLGREFLSKADRNRGKFRSLLIRSFENYIQNIRRKKRAPIGIEHDVSEYEVPEKGPHDPEAAFDYAWALTVLDRVLAELTCECKRDGLHAHWKIFDERVIKPLLEGTPALGLDEICKKYAPGCEKQASNMIVTVKRRFVRILIRYVAPQATSQAEVDAALRDFLSIFSRS